MANEITQSIRAAIVALVTDPTSRVWPNSIWGVVVAGRGAGYITALEPRELRNLLTKGVLVQDDEWDKPAYVLADGLPAEYALLRVQLQLGGAQ